MNRIRPHIGLLAATLTDAFSNEFVKGAVSAAKRLETDLTVIPGKYLGIQHINDGFEAYYEYQYNVLFNYAAKARFDYIIAPVGTIAYAYDNEQKKRFLDSFSDTPVLCVASDVEGYDCLEFDNGSGIISAVDYLAQHNRKHIGIMAGRSENSECTERYIAYRKGLEKNGLVFKESYLMYCDMSYDCINEAKKLLEDNPEIDAVICINDIIASVVYNAVKECSKTVGRDIAIIGFDDLPFAKDLNPPLATVRADAFLLGSVAVEKAYNYLNGIEDKRHLVETRFIPRESCFEDKRFIKTPKMLFMGGTDSIKNNLKEYISDRTGSYEETMTIYEPLSELIDFLEKEFFDSTASDDSVNIAYEKIMSVFPKDSTFGEVTSKLYALRESLYTWLLRNCMEENLPYIQKLLSTIENTFNQSSKSMPIRYIERTHLENLFIRDSLMFGGNLKGSYADILKRLCNIGSVTSYLYILEKPVEHYNGSEFPDDVKWLFKSFCYGAKCFNIPESEQKISTCKVFDNPKLVSDRTRILIAADLFSAQTQYGLALFEPESAEFIDELELATYQLSSAVRTLDILKNLNNLLTDTRLALAMANDYQYIYCIDTKDGSYIEYRRERTDKDFALKNRGTNFFNDCQKACGRIIYEEDRALFRDMFSKESFIKRINNGELFGFDYRYEKGDVFKYYRLKTIVGTDENEGTVFIGVTDIDAQKRREIEMKAALFKDSLTGVKNKSAYSNTEKKMNALIKENICEDFSVFVFDLNDLKKINDNFGHDEGDKYIRSGSSLICKTFKHSPVFRIGGDEFACIVKDSNYENRVQLKKQIREQVEYNKQHGFVVIAVGSADYIPNKDNCLLDVFKRADKEMYEDKKRLKNS
ncbi:GGDEF domain-containing protein [Ruminococcus sp. NK3A76]|uniref:diguanylate cyclase n=1 Tax=Ruminococcus sp. NK3A76 TaxID=877411 RepID=UPI000490277E|nr:GGDEF domain-containing protein [Ruminococcus sp. NK3A76]